MAVATGAEMAAAAGAVATDIQQQRKALMHKLGWIWLALAWPGVWLLASAMAPLILASLPADPPPPPLSDLVLLSGAQSSFMLVLAAFVGARLGPAVGLGSPVIQALLERKSVGALIGRRWRATLMGGVAGALLISGFALVLPAMVPGASTTPALPLPIRLFYGGITEEVLLRWGLMTGLLWLLWRLVQNGQGKPEGVWVMLAIALSALAFGAGHLPAAQAMLGPLPPSVALVIISGNALFGLVAGWLYWRHGLESAVAAHLLAHLLAATVTG